jgi:hypothetical protein
MEVSVQLQAPAVLPPVNNSGTCLKRGWKIPGFVLDIFEKRKIFTLAVIGITDPKTHIMVPIPAALTRNLSAILNMHL